MPLDITSVAEAIREASKLDPLKDVVIPIASSTIAVLGTYLIARSQDRDKVAEEIIKNINFLTIQCFEARCELITIKNRVSKTLNDNPYTRFISVADIDAIHKSINIDLSRWDYLTPNYKIEDEIFHVNSFIQYNAFAGNYARMFQSIEYVKEKSKSFISKCKDNSNQGVHFGYNIEDITGHFKGDLSTLVRETEQALVLIDDLITYSTLFINTFPIYVRSSLCPINKRIKKKTLTTIAMPKTPPPLVKVNLDLVSTIYQVPKENLNNIFTPIYDLENEDISNILENSGNYKKHIDKIENKLKNVSLLKTLLSISFPDSLRIFASILLIPVFASCLLFFLFFFSGQILK